MDRGYTHATVDMYIYIYICIWFYMFFVHYIFIYIYIYLCVYVYIYIPKLYIYIYIYIYIYKDDYICIYYISINKSFVTTKFLFWEPTSCNSWEKNTMW